RYFREEYEAHIREKGCPARECTTLGNYVISEDCVQCGLCRQSCPHGAVIETRDRYYIDNAICQRCGTCLGVCPTGCVLVEPVVRKEAVGT
ncbi:MAG: 4Fe-4S binding protein, partial [Bacillota bacterium]